MEQLDGRTAVITGAASGIGLELARQFGAKGMNLVIGDVEAPALEKAAASLTESGFDVLPFVLDVRHHDEIQALEAAAIERFGNVHVLCNNAGVGAGGPVADPSNLEAWRWTIDIDLWGVIYGCKVFLPAMIAHGEPCHIVNTASMAGLMALPGAAPYNATKTAVVAISEGLYLELGAIGSPVGVSVLCPGFVKTDLMEKEPSVVASPIGELIGQALAAGVETGIPADDVAAAVVAAIENRQFWILTHDDMASAPVERMPRSATRINPPLMGAG